MQEVFLMRARAVCWLVAALPMIVAALLFESVRGFRGSPFAASAAETNADWTYVDHDFSGTRYSSLKQITPQNVKQLAKVCSYTFPEKVPSETAPIVSAGVVYATSDHSTIALDGANCHVLWTYEWKPRDRDSVHAHRGASIANGKIIRGTADDYLVALKAENGHLVWARQIANPKDGYFITMPALIHRDLIYIGPAGSESAASGWVGAFRLSDGNQSGDSTLSPRMASRAPTPGDLIRPYASTPAVRFGLGCRTTPKRICSRFPAAIPQRTIMTIKGPARTFIQTPLLRSTPGPAVWRGTTS